MPSNSGDSCVVGCHSAGAATLYLLCTLLLSLLPLILLLLLLLIVLLAVVAAALMPSQQMRAKSEGTSCSQHACLASLALVCPVVMTALPSLHSSLLGVHLCVIDECYVCSDSRVAKVKRSEKKRFPE